EVGPGDTLYDLGCGDGRIVLAAARRGARAVGVDIDLQRIQECRENLANASRDVRDRTRFIRGSFFDLDVSDATVVATYLLPSVNVKLRPKLLFELRPGARIISNYFDIGDWQPDVSQSVHHRVLHKWIVPAWVEGAWRCVVNTPGERRHLTLRLRRKYQTVWGTAQIGRTEVQLVNPMLWGDRLSFTLLARPPYWRATRYEAVVSPDGGHLRGTCHTVGEADGTYAWGGHRVARPVVERTGVN
ncbi:MAG TPA: class I SAM-dependent methyltransferase, partial [Tepidisphaeraceae bacterium]|nr:class I SAM-dependent methyltransferase [Tepidisphaeraceae bacterium]